MERFVVICEPDNGKRIIKSHPLLSRLSDGMARMFFQYITMQKTGIILDKDSDENLGYLLDVPRFFLDWDKLDKKKRNRIIVKINCFLEKSNIRVICFPLACLYFTAEEIQLLEEHGIIVLDGYYHRLAGMLLVFKQLLAIMSKDVPRFETGVWGADTDAGRIWVEAMAEEVNNMCIGGRDCKELERLADYILKTTGLACQITEKAEVCLNNKNIAVLAQPAKEQFLFSRPSFLFHSYRYENDMHNLLHESVQLNGVYNIDMGWMSFPHDIDIKPSPGTCEELGVLEGLFYSASRVYRDDIQKSKISYSQIKRIQSMYEIYPLKLLGFSWKGRKVSFDRFRRNYFE